MKTRHTFNQMDPSQSRQSPRRRSESSTIGLVTNVGSEIEGSSDVGDTVLKVEDLYVDFVSGSSRLTAVDGVSLEIGRGEVLGIVGESGSGKSTLMLALLGLLPPNGRIRSGSIVLDGEEIANATPKRLSQVRGKAVGMVFQDPNQSLNPTMKIIDQVQESVLIHRPDIGRRERKRLAVEALESTGIRDARQGAVYPHVYSGGMKQRAVIASAVVNDPVLLLADEPTTALDVTTQAQIVEVIQRAIATTRASCIIVSHDLALTAQLADRVAVMYGGRFVETGPTRRVFGSPMHPYTVGLLASTPRVDRDIMRLASIPGQPPDIGLTAKGCRFVDRCELSAGRGKCISVIPELLAVSKEQAAACHFADEVPFFRHAHGAEG